MTDRPTDDGTWYDEAAGPLVRPYAMTQGRTRSNRAELDLITIVVAVVPASDCTSLPPEYQQILWSCQWPKSVVEVAAEAGLPVVVVKVLLGDLIDGNYLVYRPPDTSRPHHDLIQAVLHGLRSL